MVTAYPDYYVLLSNTATGDDSFRCSGVLIYPDLVLTSAQCAAGNVTHARVGYKDDDTTTVSVTGVLSHANSPRWSPNHNNKVADIAIITLDTAIEGVTFPTLQSPIMNGLNQLGKEYVVYGAGDFRQGGATAAFLHGDKVATTSLRECATTYRESDRRVVLDQDYQFCAGIKDMEAGPCSIGDWGAPLLQISDETVGGSEDDILVGLASDGNPGCGEHDPSYVYTRIVAHYDWIQRTFCFESANPPKDCKLAYSASPSSAPSVAPYDQTNFFVILSDTTHGRGTMRCGGSLLTPTFVLTASSCLTSGGASSMVARVGYETDERSFAIRTVAKVIDHPASKGQHENFPNDVALVVLEEPVYNVSTVTVNTIKAFPPDNSFPLLYREAGSLSNQNRNFRLGQSRTRDIANETTLRSSFHEGEVATYQFPNCLQAYKNHIRTSSYYASDLDEGKQFCVVDTTGAGTNGPCDVGAWGSPLYEIQPDDGRILQVGVYSQGYCTSAAFGHLLPHVYTRLAYYADWIQAQVCLYSQSKPAGCESMVRRKRRGLRSGVDAVE
eukprot:CAMPEP_0119031788 /NCGR_PEP_ID=MMETSP1176-20130426/41722_1 /TAXON_ID=265551 /ORGANISM="Synedropsis recta cf, Strain CCMP1620" /LENGTH=554 /DNA_ID=CAMNT_0006988191 /DNA_START=117 /DNA_END=1781 /DNA_ORIENTATION=-